MLVAPTAETITNGRDFFPAYNLKGEKVNLSTQNLPEIPVLIITFSEKEGNYLDSPNPMPLQKINSPYVHFFRLNKLYIKHDYEGWFSGDMEIYFKIKKKEYTFGDYGSWYQINLGSLSSNQTKIYDPPVNIASSLTDEYYIKIEIWEDDGWGTGDDDFVADEHYNTALIGSYVANLWYNMGGVSEFRFADMGAYGNDIWAVDGITGSQDYDTITLTKYVVEQSAQ